MTKNYPLVTVTVVCYQHEEFIGACLESIINQTYPNIEILVGDDGSTDKSREIINSYAAKHPNVISFFSPINQGPVFNSRNLLNQAKGDYICLYDGDDVMYPEKIEKQVKFLEENKDYDMCFHNVDVYDNSTKTYLYKWLDRYLPTRNASDALFIANWFFKKQMRRSPSASRLGRASYLKAGYHETRVSAFGEFNFFLSIDYAFPDRKWHTIPEVLGLYRQHSANISKRYSGWIESAEEATVCYSLAALRYPRYFKKIRNEEAYWWFNQLLYKQVPKEFRTIYIKEFYGRFGFVKFMYLQFCTIALNKKLANARLTIKKMLFLKK